VLLAAFASADRLIDIPTARKIVYLDFRYEFRAQPFAGGAYEHYLGIGVGKAFELDLRNVVPMAGRPEGTFDFAYDYIAAIPGASPGISMGVQDAANVTQDGRRFYAVTTYREPLDVINGSVNTDVTIGVQTGSLTSPFVGFLLPFSKQFFLVGEDSGFRVSAGIELRPANNVSIRFVTRGSTTLLSLSASSRF